MSNDKENNKVFENVLVSTLKVPGVKVNRREFLMKAFDKHAKENGINIVEILDRGPVKAGLNIKTLDKIAASIIEKRTLQSAGTSFLAGLPGGMAMFASIPADTLQFFGVALTLSQELAYIYGYNDMYVDGNEDIEDVKENLTLFLGVMFGVGGASSALKAVSSGFSKQLLKTLPQKALTKTVYYPIIKKIANTIGMKMTKETFAKGVSKVIPVLGGVISGSLTYVSMKPMGSRLKDTLSNSINYTQEEFNRDFRDMNNFVDVDFNEVNNQSNKVNDESLCNGFEEVAADEEKEVQRDKNSSYKGQSFSVADELLKFKQLLDMGVVTEEEFNIKKQELLYPEGKH